MDNELNEYTREQLLTLFDVFRETRPKELREVIYDNIEDIITHHSLCRLSIEERKKIIAEARVKILAKYDAGNVRIFTEYDKRELVCALIEDNNITEEEKEMMGNYLRNTDVANLSAS